MPNTEVEEDTTGCALRCERKISSGKETTGGILSYSEDRRRSTAGFNAADRRAFRSIVRRLDSAEDTWIVTSRENRKMPTFKKSPGRVVFYYV